MLVSPIRHTRHDGSDDLLSAGLGLSGLQSMQAPAFADVESPSCAEVRRRQIWSNWRGIADLSPGGGYGDVYGAVPHVAGDEFQALLQLPHARQPHRVLVQIPDGYDKHARCVLVTAVSGSRGIYGAVALASAWGLPRGCVVASTDKGAGTGHFDVDSDSGVALEGLRATRGSGLEFEPDSDRSPEHTIAVKHAHSGDNPEADWGRHVLQAAQFALEMLAEARPQEAPFTFSNTRIIGVGLSNGGGAVLRAAELDRDGCFDGVVAVAPNVYAKSEGGRPLYDYATEAALWHPCALLHPQFDALALVRPGGSPLPAGVVRATALHEFGWIEASTPAAQANEAVQRLHAVGWTAKALAAGATSVAFDLWRAVAICYASAYQRSTAGAMPGGYRYAALDAQARPRATSSQERMLWSTDGGIPPGAAAGIVDGLATGHDPALPGLRALRDGWAVQSSQTEILRASILATRCGLPRAGVPLLVVHGIDDGLVPEAFSSIPYVNSLVQNGLPHAHWRVANAQHFDALLGLPMLSNSFVPLLPYAYAALDAMWVHLAGEQALPRSANIATTPRSAGKSLRTSDLGMLPPP
ncbi:MAG: 3-hydroxybutyrate oligomer hydrolase family protein [Tahibacter sp.]